MTSTKETINGEAVLKDINIDDLKVLFDEYNRKYFSGRLPRCELKKLSRRLDNGATWGHFTDKHNGTYSIEINLNNNVMWTRSSLRDILVHEMIHYHNQLCYGFTGMHHLPPFVTSMLWMNLKHKELHIRCHEMMPLRRKREQKKEDRMKWWEWLLMMLLVPLGVLGIELSGLYIVPRHLYRRLTGKIKVFTNKD